MDHLGDWELAKAVGVPTSLPQPVVWTNASNTDRALLTGYTSLIRKANPICNPPSSLGVTAAIRFAYTNALEYLLSHHLPLTYSLFKHDIVPKPHRIMVVPQFSSGGETRRRDSQMYSLNLRSMP